MIMALPRPLEAALQDLERRGREVSGKIAKAAEAVSGDGDDLDDPSVVRQACELAQVARAVTPPRGSETPRLGTPVRPARRLRSHS